MLQADLCVPRLNEGDQVVLINGRDIAEHTHDQVVLFIKASCERHSGELVLLVRPNGKQSTQHWIFFIIISVSYWNSSQSRLLNLNLSCHVSFLLKVQWLPFTLGVKCVIGLLAYHSALLTLFYAGFLAIPSAYILYDFPDFV